MSHALTKLSNDNVSADDSSRWAAYHSSHQQQTSNLPAITALLPLFYEKADTPAMVKHGMDVPREATSFLNPGQVPVITLDQPLFAHYIIAFTQGKSGTIACCLNNLNFRTHFCNMLRGQYTREEFGCHQNKQCRMFLPPQSSHGSKERQPVTTGLDDYPQSVGCLQRADQVHLQKALFVLQVC